jgi:peptidoglycan biosynthesis protein MviN/MurJ (putative lipid II flippase)
MFKSVGLMAVISIFTIFLSLANSVIFAQYFGTSREIEVYFAVLVLFSLVYKLTQTGQLTEIFLPRYNQVKSEKGMAEALKEFSVVINQMSIFTLIICCFLYLSSNTLIELLMPGFDVKDRELGLELFTWLIPLIFCQVLSSLFKIILMAEEKYVLGEWIDFSYKLLQLLLVLLLLTPGDVWPLIYAVMIAIVFKTIILFFFLLKEGYKHYFIIKNPEFNFFKPMLSFYRYVGATQVYAFILTSAVTMLPQGYFAIYKYVENIYNAMSNVITRPIGQVFFSKFSKAYSQGERELNELGRLALSYVLFVVMIIIVPFVSAGDLVFSVMWHSENFTMDKVKLAHLFIIFLFGVILIDAVNIISRRIVVSIGFVHKQYNYMVFSQIGSALFAYILIPILGLKGVVATLAVNKILLSLSALSILWFKGRGFIIFYSWRRIGVWMPVLVISVFISFAVRDLIYDGVESGKVVLFLDAMIISFVGVVSVFFLSYLMKVKETLAMFNKLKRMFFRA